MPFSYSYLILKMEENQVKYIVINDEQIPREILKTNEQAGTYDLIIKSNVNIFIHGNLIGSYEEIDLPEFKVIFKEKSIFKSLKMYQNEIFNIVFTEPFLITNNDLVLKIILP